MKTQSEHVQRWEDIIFENRNKEYGAYAIRKNYNTNVLKAEAISIGIGLLIFIIPILVRDEKISIPIIEKPDDGIVLRQFPKIEPIKTPPTRIQPPRRLNAEIIPIHVTTANVIEDPTVEPAETISYVTSSETGTTDSGVENPIETGGGGVTAAVKNEPFIIAEVMPEYDGGYEAMMRFIQRKMRYPSIAIRKKDEGTVYISFVVSADGRVTNVQVIKGVSKECDQEAVRVISMMDKWKPGMQNKMPVPVKKVLPITFKLEH